jgi:hypothetical protein
MPVAYQACPINRYDQKKVAKIIKLTSDHILLMAVVDVINLCIIQLKGVFDANEVP